MPRPARIEFPGALYFISINAAPGARIFQDNIDRNRFIQILDTGIKRYRLILHAYTLLDDGYMLLIETPMANLTRAVQYINSHYMAYVTTRRGSTGRLFAGRYKSPLVQKDRYLLDVNRYIHIAPARLGLSASPELYQWSSYQAYTQPYDRPPAVTTKDSMSFFDGEQQARRHKFEQYIQNGLTAGQDPAVEENLKKNRILGTPEFLKIIQQGIDNPTPEAAPAMTPPAVVLIETAAYFNVQVDTITNNKIKPNVPRNVAIFLCRNITGVPLEDLGEVFGVGPSSICNTAKRVDAHRKSDKGLEKSIADIERNSVAAHESHEKNGEKKQD